MKAKMSAAVVSSATFGAELFAAIIPAVAAFVAVTGAGFYANDVLGVALARTFSTF